MTAAPERVLDGSVREMGGTILVAMLAALLAVVPELARPGFYFHDDMELQYVPVLRAMGQVWWSGSVPLLLDGTWFGGAIAGEYQHGVFSIAHAALAVVLAVARLSPAAVATTVTLVYVAITAAGAFRLARQFGLPALLASSVALVGALNGFNVTWGSWLPALTGFAWIPWFWWALARRLGATAPWSGHVALAVTTYLVLSAGWHFSVLMLALVLGYALCCSRGTKSPLRAVLSVAPGLGAGLLLAAPALLCFLEYAAAAVRTDLDRVSSAWTVPLAALAGLVLPRTAATWEVFGVAQTHPNSALANGVLPTLLAVTALAVVPRSERREPLKLLAFAAVVLGLALLPSVWRARWPFRWLPLVHLLVALAAAKLVESGARSLRAPARSLVGFVSLLSPWVLVAIVAALALGVAADGFALAALVAFASALGVDLARHRASALRVAVTAGVAANLLVTPLLGPARDATPGWDLSSCAERLGANARGARHLGVYVAQTVIDGHQAPYGPVRGRRPCLLPGNLGLLFDRPFVNGYSTLFPSGLAEILELGVHGDIGGSAVEQIIGAWAAPGSLLDRWGIRALTVPGIAGVSEKLEASGWRRERDLGDGYLLTRGAWKAAALVEPFSPAEASKSIRTTKKRLIESAGRVWIYTGRSELTQFSKASETEVRLEQATRNGVEARVRAPRDGPGLVLLRRPYFPGYVATLDGRPVALGRADGVFVVAEIPAGAHGRLRIEYVPLGVRLPALGALFLGVVSLAAFVWAGRRSSPAAR